MPLRVHAGSALFISASPQGRPIQSCSFWAILASTQPVITLGDMVHLEAAESWLERGDCVNCFDELERIDYNNSLEARPFSSSRLSDSWLVFMKKAGTGIENLDGVSHVVW
jgi:hypothetical protein